MRKLDMNRRTFLSGAALAVAGCVSGRPRPKLLKPGDRLNMGFVGVGGKGVQDLMEFVRCGENPVCLCDVDRTLVDIALGHLKKAGFDTAKIRCYADYRKMIENSIPVGFVGQSEDIAPTVLLLVSEEGRYITGADIPIDGGMSIPFTKGK